MSPAASVPSRVAVFDGLRGVAIILVVLSHGWTLWPFDYLLDHEPFHTLFTAGNFAVSIFFVVGAFVATQGLLRRAQSPMGLHPVVDLVRRYVRLTGQVAFFLLVLVLVSVFDDTESYEDTSTSTSVVRVLTYSWNWFVRADSYAARPDLGHLWYLSVYLQALVLITVLVWLLRRRRGWLIATLSALIVASWMWTDHVSGTETGIATLLRTSVRIDAPLAGALAAVILPYLGRVKAHAGWVAGIGLLTLVPLIHLTTREGYLGAPGHLTVVALFVFVLGTALASSPRLLAATVGWRPLVLLGSRSLGLYIWHYPVFFFVARHNLDWHWGWRTVLALAITGGCVLVSELLVERRVQRALASPGWRELDYGIPAYLRRRSRSMRPSHRLTRSSEMSKRRLTRS